MSLVTICIIFVVIGTPCIDANNQFFRSDYTFVSELNAYLKLSAVKESWTGAVANCRNEGAMIAIPTSKAQADAIIKFSGRKDLWLGIHDLFAEGEFLTVDGISVDNIYMNWRSGEPSDSKNVENCATLEPDGSYNDISCDSKISYVCVRPVGNIRWNSACHTYDPDYVYSSDLQRCYKYHKTPRNWHDAFRVCKAEQSSLAIINSRKEVDFLINIINKYPPNRFAEHFDKGNIHLGFHDLIMQGSYLTIEGKALSETGYTNWGGGQPDNHLNNEHCGAMFLDGHLNDLNCKAKALFICEKQIDADFENFKEA